MHCNLTNETLTKTTILLENIVSPLSIAALNSPTCVADQRDNNSRTKNNFIFSDTKG